MINKLRHSILPLMIFILLSFIWTTPILATDVSPDVNTDKVNTNSSACILMDAKSGKILYSKNAYSKMYPASTTKLMTAILTLENCKLTDVATVSHNAIYSIPVGYSHANLKEGEELTIEQLLNVLLIPSANDAAIVLAEHISGSTDEFAKLMNQKAKDFGCQGTNFINPNGIHNKEHYSCAYDLALIGQYAMKFSDIMRIAMVKQYTLPTTNKYDKTDRIFNATNVLINDDSMNKYYYPYATGLKTGYTDSSGYCIVSTAKKDDMELIVVVLNASSIANRFSDCKSLFDYGFEHYSYQTLQSIGSVVKTVEISNGTKETKQLDIVVKDDISVLLSSDIELNELEPNVELESDLKAPIAENKVIGKISYTIDGEIFSSDLVAASSVIPSSFEVLVFRVLLIFLILYIIYRLLKHNSKNKPSRKSHSNNSNTYRINSNRKPKKRRNKYSKFENLSDDIPRIHNGKGDFKFTQMHDFL